MDPQITWIFRNSWNPEYFQRMTHSADQGLKGTLTYWSKKIWLHLSCVSFVNLQEESKSIISVIWSECMAISGPGDIKSWKPKLHCSAYVSNQYWQTLVTLYTVCYITFRKEKNIVLNSLTLLRFTNIATYSTPGNSTSELSNYQLAPRKWARKLQSISL